MATKATPIPFFFCFLSVLCVAVSDHSIIDADFGESRRSPALKVAHLLNKNGLPEGLLPSSILHHEISEDGTLKIDLESACYANFEQEVLWFDKHIECRVGPGKLDSISGISAKQLFFWLPVTAIHVGEGDEADKIYLDIGPLSKKISASAFEKPVECSEGEEGTFSSIYHLV